MQFANEFDYIVVNDQLEKAEQEAYSLVAQFLKKDIV